MFCLVNTEDMSKIQTLSISRHNITSVAVNRTGEWIAFASKKLGQLLVWEWKSETYIMKQQGHHYDLGSLAYSPNGQLIATGGDDHKVKIWDTRSWFCFVTFSEHRGPVTAVAFVPNGLSVVSSSLDGTVRAFDLIRYRNYRTLQPPSPTQLSCVAVDSAGEIVAAASLETFEIYVWSLQTGKLLDVLGGHEGPICALAFAPASQLLASASWDKTVRLWETFEGRPYKEALQHGADCLAVAWKPDGSELATTALDGTINFWDPEEGTLLGTIEGRDDIAGGRRAGEARTAKNSARGKAFTSLCYSADGTCVLAGGESKYVCLYSIARRILLRRFQTSRNMSLDGVLDFLNSARMTEAGSLDDIDDVPSDPDDIEGDDDDIALPGAKRGDTGARKVRPAIATKALRFAPDGRAWAAATTEGLLVYSLDETAAFDPYDLDVDVTEEAVAEAVAAGEHLKSLILAFRLNELPSLTRAFEAVPAAEIPFVAQQLPTVYVQRLLVHIALSLETRPFLEICLLWAQHLFYAHGEFMRQNQALLGPALRLLHKQLVRHQTNISSRCADNKYSLQYIFEMAKMSN